ncbi:divalent-cation tolerance protein CutA [Nitrospira japonica]|nr:divalent-cation tolerance protein CutA [Nitrospira japonica]
MTKRSLAHLAVLTTVPDQKLAARMSKTLVSKRLVACATIIGKAQSFYEWKGKMVQDSEVLIIMKTTARRYPALERAIKALHPYEVPEIIGLSVKSGFAPYLAWIFTQVDQSKQN